MRYARLDTSPTKDPDFCFAASVKERGRIQLKSGKPVGDRYPDDPLSFHVHLDPDFTGVALPDLLGNTQGFLMLSARARDAFAAAELDLGTCEVHPFTLINHKGRVHSTDYAFVNPLGTHDVAHPASDFLRYQKSQEIYGCKGWVLDTNKLSGKPDLLRAREVPTHYFVSEKLVEVVRSAELTNFELIEVSHLAGDR